MHKKMYFLYLSSENVIQGYPEVFLHLTKKKVYCKVKLNIYNLLKLDIGYSPLN